MSQASPAAIPTSGPSSGAAVFAAVRNAVSAIQSGNSGTSEPTYKVIGTLWLDTGTADLHVYKRWDGIAWRTLFTIVPSTGKITLFGDLGTDSIVDTTTGVIARRSYIIPVGATGVEVTFPAAAVAARFLYVGKGDSSLTARVSMDGTTFLAGVTDYKISSIVQASGSLPNTLGSDSSVLSLAQAGAASTLTMLVEGSIARASTFTTYQTRATEYLDATSQMRTRFYSGRVVPSGQPQKLQFIFTAAIANTRLLMEFI